MRVNNGLRMPRRSLTGCLSGVVEDSITSTITCGKLREFPVDDPRSFAGLGKIAKDEEENQDRDNEKSEKDKSYFIFYLLEYFKRRYSPTPILINHIGIVE